MITDQQALSVIELICGDDFCEDLAMRMADGSVADETLTMAHEKLSMVYRIAHGIVLDHSCYRVHDDWREEAAKLATEMGVADEAPAS